MIHIYLNLLLHQKVRWVMEYKIHLVHNYFSYNDPVTYLSWVIRKGTGGFYNHVAIEVNGEIIEAVGLGVIKRSVEEWRNSGNRVVQTMIPHEEMTASQYEHLLSLVGVRYGYLDIVRVGWHYVVTNRLNIKRKREPYNGKGYICSELAALLLQVEWFIVPHEFEYLPNLTRGEKFETFKATK